MKSRWSCHVCACLLAITAAGGDLNGHVVVTRRLSRKPLSAPVYNLRGAAPEQKPARNVNEFEHVVLWLEGGDARPNPPETASMDQRDIDFYPDMLIVPTGSTVNFPNSDPIFHNVFSLSKAKTFDLGFYARGQSRSVKFDHPGIVQVYCHVHSRMYAAIVVTSSRWYGKPGDDGSFSWPDIPGGNYHLCAWHKVAGLFKTEVTVSAQGASSAVIRIPLDTGQD